MGNYISVPHGKFVAYNSDGSVRVPLDVYVSEKAGGAKIELVRILPKKAKKDETIEITDFKTNTIEKNNDILVIYGSP